MLLTCSQCTHCLKECVARTFGVGKRAASVGPNMLYMVNLRVQEFVETTQHQEVPYGERCKERSSQSI